MSLNVIKDVATIIGVVIALGGLMKGVDDFSNQGAQKRAEFFWKIWLRLKEVPERKVICDVGKYEVNAAGNRLLYVWLLCNSLLGHI
jgi:hypothetical protein